MPEYLNQLLTDKATSLVRENFAGVQAEWWWERRLGGGIAICQELDPTSLARAVSSKTGRDEDEVRRMVEEELGLEGARENASHPRSFSSVSTDLLRRPW